mgnify:CR=1 FL=1
MRVVADLEKIDNLNAVGVVFSAERNLDVVEAVGRAEFNQTIRARFKRIQKRVTILARHPRHIVFGVRKIDVTLRARQNIALDILGGHLCKFHQTTTILFATRIGTGS